MKPTYSNKGFAKLSSIVTVLLIAVIALVSRNALAQNTPGRILIRVQPGIDINKVAATYGLSVLRSIPAKHMYALSVPVGNETTTATQIGADARVLYAEADVKVSAPVAQFPLGFDGSGTPGHYVNPSQLQQINFNSGTMATSGSGIVVAVLDTGTTPTHPALTGHLLPGYNMLQPGSPPLDVADGTTNVAVGHGTMVTGIVAAIAPGAQIMPIRVLNADGTGTTTDIVNAIEYAIANGANVINMSFGAAKGSHALNDAIKDARDAGVVLVASTGNDNDNDNHYPASYKEVIAVSSVDANNVKSGFANYGSYVDVVAPGDNVTSTWWNGAYESWSGTSFAAPFVSAEAALVMAAFPGLNPRQVQKRIEKSAVSVESLNPSFTDQLGDGIINIAVALQP